MVSISEAKSQLCHKDIYFNTPETQQQCPNHVNSQAINLWLQQVKYGQCVLFSVLQFPDHPALILRLTQWLEGKQAQSRWRHHSLCRNGQSLKPKSTPNGQSQCRRNPCFPQRTIIWKVPYISRVGRGGMGQRFIGCNSWNFLNWHLDIYNS